MKKRKLGRTEYDISAMGFGCGGYWGYKIFDEGKAINLVHQAIDGGVNFFDTGASYSGGNAEIRLGKALKGKRPNDLIIGTKVGTVITRSGLVKDFSRKSIFRQIESSLQNLGVDALPLVQLHSPDIPDLNDDTFETFNLLKDQGKVKLVGSSCDHNVLVAAVLSDYFDVVMMTYNMIEKKAIEQLNFAYDHGCGVLVKSPMCHALYSNEIFRIRGLSDLWYFLRVLKNYRPMLVEGFKYRFVNNITGWSPHEIALLYALDEKVSCVVTGTTKSENMSRNLMAMDKCLPSNLRRQIDDV